MEGELQPFSERRVKVSELNFEEVGEPHEGGTAEDYSRMKDAVL